MMTFITIHALEKFTRLELEALHKEFMTLLMATDANTPERRNILATLENIESVLHRRLIVAPGVP